MDSENVTALSNIAFIYFFDKERNDKNVEWAIQYAERALLVDPNDVISLVVKANSFFETNLDGNAELCLKKALASEQTEHYAYQYALYALAQIYADNDNIDEAMNSLRSLFNITDIFKEDINKNKRFKKLKNIEEFKKFVDWSKGVSMGGLNKKIIGIVTIVVGIILILIFFGLVSRLVTGKVSFHLFYFLFIAGGISSIISGIRQIRKHRMSGFWLKLQCRL